MRVLAIAQVEDDTNVKKQIEKQTVKPTDVFIYTDPNPAKGINPRRKRIAQNHKTLRDVVAEHDPILVWQLEGDVDLDPDCLDKLIQSYVRLSKIDPDFGYVSGIQVGRHGLYHLGAWHIGHYDFKSLDYKATGINQVDATGLYCLLATSDVWLSGECDWDDEPWGPDVNFGLSIQRNIYVDMNIPVGHIITRRNLKRGIIHPYHSSTCNVRFYQEDGRWVYKQTN